MKRILAACVAAGILLFPQQAVDGAQRAMRVWFGSVAPALFPFMALMPVFADREACRFYDRFLSGMMKRLFHLPGAAAPAMMIGMISGSPGGAAAACAIAREAGLKKNDVHRLALSLCGLSPAYLLMGIGGKLYGSYSVGWKLVLLQAGIQLTMLAGLRGIRFAGDEICSGTGSEGSNGIKQAVESVLGVCGYMVLFGAGTEVIKHLTGSRSAALIQLLLDLPGGSAALAEMETPVKMLLQCGGIGFGGFCISMQNMDVLRNIGVKWKDYLVVRGVAAALFLCGGCLLIGEGGNLAAVEAVNMRTLAFSLLCSCIFVLPWLINHTNKSIS